MRFGPLSLTSRSLLLVALTSFCCLVAVRHIFATASQSPQIQALRRRGRRRLRHVEMNRRRRGTPWSHPTESVSYPALPDDPSAGRASSSGSMEPASVSESSQPTSAAIPPGMNLLLPSGAVLSTDMVAMLLHRRDHNNCTARCLPCHFHEMFHRELAEEDCYAVLEGDMEPTDQYPQNGITDVMGAAVPTGIFYEVTSYVRGGFTNLQIKEFINIRFATILDQALIASIAQTYEDRALSRFIAGRGYDLSTERPPHVGRRIDSLPSTPVTAREGNPRTSFITTPPPLYRSNAILRDLIVGEPLPPLGPAEVGVPVYTARHDGSPTTVANVPTSANSGRSSVNPTRASNADPISPLLLEAQQILPLRPPPLPLRSSRRPAANALPLASPPRTRHVASALRHQSIPQSNLLATPTVPSPSVQDDSSPLPSEYDRETNLPIRIGSPAPTSFREIQFNNPADAEPRAPFARASTTLRHRSDGWRWAAQSSPSAARERRHASETADSSTTITRQRRQASEVVTGRSAGHQSTPQVSPASAAQGWSPAPAYETIQFGNPFQRRAQSSSADEHQDSPPRSLYTQRRSAHSSNQISPRNMRASESPASVAHRDAATALLELRERVTRLEGEDLPAEDRHPRPQSFVRRRHQPRNPWNLLNSLLARDTTNTQGYNVTERRASEPNQRTPIFTFNRQVPPRRDLPEHKTWQRSVGEK